MDWEQWTRFLLANRNALTGHVRVSRDAMSVEEVRKLLAEYKHHAQIIDPPAVTGTQLQSQRAVDPALIESWNHLEPWERAMWKAYWEKLPDATQSDRAVRVRDLRMTQAVRFHIALQSSVGYMGAGFRDAAGALFDDSTFMAVVVGGITIYAIAILLPEPLFSKVTAAAITAFLLASSFTLSEIIDVVKAWFRLRKDAGRARSMAALDAAARDFGRAIGGAGFRVLLTLFTYFAGRALPAPKVGAPVGPAGGAAVTGGGASSGGSGGTAGPSSASTIPPQPRLKWGIQRVDRRTATRFCGTHDG